MPPLQTMRWQFCRQAASRASGGVRSAALQAFMLATCSPPIFATGSLPPSISRKVVDGLRLIPAAISSRPIAMSGLRAVASRRCVDSRGACHVYGTGACGSKPGGRYR